MAIAKVILNGDVLMDVTQKTVTPATLLSGTTALKNDGTNITGTLQPGPDCPVFTVIYQDDNMTGTPTITCNKTGQECLDYVNGNVLEYDNQVAILELGYIYDGAPLIIQKLACSGKCYDTNNDELIDTTKYYVFDYGDEPLFTIIYPVNGSITIDAPSYGSVGQPVITKGALSRGERTINAHVSFTRGLINTGSLSATPLVLSTEDFVDGTLSITENGQYTVSSYESVDVDVPTSSGNAIPLTVMPGNNETIYDATIGDYSKVTEIYVNDVDSGAVFTTDLSSFSAGNICKIEGTLQTINNGYYVNATDITTVFEWPSSNTYEYSKGIFTLLITSTSITIRKSIQAGGISAQHPSFLLYVYKAPRTQYVGYNPVTIQSSPAAEYIKIIERDPTLISMSYSNISVIGNFAFAHMSSLQFANFENCTAVGASAFFSDINLVSAYFPNCSSIGYQAFAYCSALSDISLPNCSYMSSSAFYNCKSLASITLENCLSISGYAFGTCINLIYVSAIKCKGIGNSAFYNCSALQSIYLPSCSIIGAYAFMNCSSLATISFPTCRGLYSNAFQGCRALTSAIFPSCISLYGDSVFYNCSSLSTASFPILTSFSGYTFRNCYRLQTLYIGLSHNSVVTLPASNVFSSTPFNGYIDYIGAQTSIAIYVPSSLVNQYKSSTNWTYYSSYIIGI